MDAISMTHTRTIPTVLAKIAAAACLTAALMGSSPPAALTIRVAEPAPAVTWRSMLGVDVYDSGFLGFRDVDVAFAPESPGACSIVVREQEGEVLSNLPFAAGRFDGYTNRNGVFARLSPSNPAEHTFGKGEYVIEYYVAGKVATRLSFTVVTHTTSDDPFDPGSTLRFVGPWQRFAYFTFDRAEEEGAEPVVLNLWAGASDLGRGESRVPVKAVLERDGEVVAHTKREAGIFLDHVWMDRHDVNLFLAHAAGEERSAAFLTRAMLQEDGRYRLTVAREDDGTTLRAFAFEARDGALVPHPRTALGYQPHADYIVPRVLKEGSTTFEFEEAFWIEAPSE